MDFKIPSTPDEMFKKMNTYRPGTTNIEHTAEKVFTSGCWLIYCAIQTLFTISLMIFVIYDIDSK